MSMEKISVIIPAYQPDDTLLSTITELINNGFSDILVVDDGSSVQSENVFRQIEGIPQCTLLKHPENRGKGAALKTAMRYFMEKRPDKQCVVTADADGQHLVADIIAVSRAALASEKVILGTRDFSGSNVPSRSKMGNQITITVFRLFFGMKIRDTQTGLRAFPRKYIPHILEAKGNRYEYETNMLFQMNRHNIPYDQVNISTVYIDDNRSSHFRVVRDSVRIYGLILKYLLSSIAASVIDELAFYVLKKLDCLTWIPIPLTYSASFLARVISSLVNYSINAKVVFGENVNLRTIVRYYILAVLQIALSATLVFASEHILGISSPAFSTGIKMVIDTVLFFFSFRIQHKWVFGKEQNT